MNANPLYLHGRSSRASSLATFKLTVPTMNPTRVLYEPIEDLERMEYYQHGGYHPVTIGIVSTVAIELSISWAWDILDDLAGPR